MTKIALKLLEIEQFFPQLDLGINNIPAINKLAHLYPQN